MNPRRLLEKAWLLDAFGPASCSGGRRLGASALNPGVAWSKRGVGLRQYSTDSWQRLWQLHGPANDQGEQMTSNM